MFQFLTVVCVCSWKTTNVVEVVVVPFVLIYLLSSTPLFISQAVARCKVNTGCASHPAGLVDDARDDNLFLTPDPQSSTTPTNLPPATACTIPPPTTADSDPASYTTQADPPPSTNRRRHALASFSASGARALLHRAIPGFRHSRPSATLSTRH